MIHIRDEDAVKRKIAELVQEGASRLHIVSDFDQTLTYAIREGKKSGAFFDKVDQSPKMPLESQKVLADLFDYYYPIEFDPHKTIAEKTPFMVEWWKKYFDELIKCRFPLSEIIRIANEDAPVLREGNEQFFFLLQKANVPLLIFSAGMGDGIMQILKHQGLYSDNVHIISNFLEFDGNGITIGYKENFIHTFNKGETALDDEYKKEILGKDNVILLGDSIGDLSMVDGIEHDCVLKIGFLNTTNEASLKQYMEGYDIVLTSDGSLDYVNAILSQIIS